MSAKKLPSFAFMSVLFLLGAVPVSATDEIDGMLKLWNFQDPAATEQQFNALLERQTDDKEFASAILSQIARTHSLRRNFESAHDFLDQAEVNLQEGMSKARVLVALERGRTFNSSNEKSKALNQFRDAFQIADAAGIDGLCVDAAHMIAIAEEGQRAERWNLIALQIAETSDDPDARRWLGSLYNNLGWTYFDAGELVKALDLFERAAAFRKESDDTYRWQIARWTVARTWRELGRIDEALDEQLALKAEVGDDPSQLGYIDEELGELYLLKDDNRSALHFANAYKILSQDGWLIANEADRLARLKQLGGGDD